MAQPWVPWTSGMTLCRACPDTSNPRRRWQQVRKQVREMRLDCESVVMHEHLGDLGSSASGSRAVTRPTTFEMLDTDCLAQILLFIPPCCMRRAACVDQRMRNAVVGERARRVALFPAGATKRTTIESGLGSNMLCCASDGSCLVGAGSTASCREATVYADDLTIKGVLRAHSTRVTAVATDGKHHATGHLNGNIQIWHAATLASTGYLKHGRSTVLGLALCADVLISGSMDSTAKCWSVSSSECHATLQHHRNKTVNSVDVDEEVVATASDDRTARLWAHGSATSKHVLQHAAEVNTVSLSGEFVATGCYDNLVRLFAVDNGQLMRTLQGHGCRVLAVYATDGVIVSGACDNTVRVWLMEEEAVAVLRGHSAGVQGVALAPCGSLVTSLSNNEVLTWRSPTLAPALRRCGCHGKCKCPRPEPSS